MTVSKQGKAPQIISAGEVFVIHLSQGEELALSGTAGNILSIYDHADVKLIPAAREVLGKVQVADGTTTSQLLAIDSAGLPGAKMYVLDSASSIWTAVSGQVSAGLEGAVVIIGGATGPITAQIVSPTGGPTVETSNGANLATTTPGIVARIIDQKGLADSISIGGSVTAPAASASIATMTPGVAGVYEVYVTAAIVAVAGGTPVAGDMANMIFRVTTTNKQTLPYTTTFGGPFGPYRLTLTAANTLNVIVGGNTGTANIVYTAGITCRRVA